MQCIIQLNCLHRADRKTANTAVVRKSIEAVQNKHAGREIAAGIGIGVVFGSSLEYNRNIRSLYM
jgi:hypothetical protein